MNGKERNISVFRKLSAYIMQDNQLHANLTVEEAMNVASNLKLSQKVLRGEKMNVVSSFIPLWRPAVGERVHCSQS
jgi:ATP-binding cassette subfamily G (WHITE) protein 1